MSSNRNCPKRVSVRILILKRLVSPFRAVQDERNASAAPEFSRAREWDEKARKKHKKPRK